MKNKWNSISFLTSFITCLICIFFINGKANTPIVNKLPPSNVSAKDTTDDSKKIDKNAINNTKIIYLTFDDGPSPVTTDKILDVLSKYNVKATFFVVGKELNGREDILKRIYREEHGIGLHTYSHNFKKIYKSNDIFINEMLKTSECIKSIIGIEPKFIRFPGGSHNRLSNNFLEKLHKYGFIVFDWTNSSEDGVNPNSPPEKLYNNSLRRVISHKTFPGIILLMHCNQNNKNTYKALPKIIEHYKNKGYEFKILSDTTPEYISE